MNQNQPPPYQPPPPRKPVNPWNIVGWVVVGIILLVIVGSCINSQHGCSNGTYWDSTSQTCQ